MSHYSDQDPARGRFHEGAGARAPASACGAGELRGLLQHIADHIAHADERQQTAMREMQSRLEHLADEAQLVRDVVPPEFAAAFARIEDGIATLTERISSGDGGYTARHREHQRDPGDDAIPAFDRASQSYEAAERSWPQPAEAPLPLKSAADGSGSHAWDHGGSWSARPQPETEAFAPDAPTDVDGDWDRASAEALARAYEPEPEHAGHQFVAGQAAGHGFEDEGEEADQRAHERDTGEALEQRFVEIAARLEQALAGMRLESSVGALEARFDSFEEKIGSAFDGLATRADVEGLKHVETHIVELAEHIDLTRSRLARLDDIEAHLTRLAEQVSDERFSRLIEQSEPDVARLAEFVAERLGGPNAWQAESSADAERLAELRDIVEQFVSSRRQGDEHAAGVLETIQQAVLSLLDRMDALEQAHALRAGEAGEQDGAFGYDGRGASAQVYMHPAMAASTGRAGETPPLLFQDDEAALDDIGAEIQQARSAAREEIASATAANDPAGGEAEPAQESAPAAAMPLQASREDFIAAARRAARKASSLAAGEREDPLRAGVRPRMSAGSRHAGSRPVTGLVVAALAVVLAVGIGFTTYSIFKGTANEPAAIERSGLEQGAADRQTALGSKGGDRAPGGLAGGAAGGAPASDAAASPAAPASDGFVIEDEAATPGSLPGEDDDLRGRKVTGLPGGIMLDTGLIATAEDIARTHRQQAMAQLSSQLGAAQSGAAAIPAALVPQAGEALPAATSGEPRGGMKEALPPAAVGPLSLRIAAADGEPSAAFEVAARLAEGRGVQQDLKAAVSWYQRAAAQGFAPAQYRLGTHYERGLGVKADSGRAKAWYRSAAEKGNLKAMHNLGVLSANGNPADYGTAAHWFAEAAARGLGDSQYNLAVLHESGRGVERNLEAAYKWFALAARSGDKEAARRRDQVRSKLDAGQLKTADAFVASWKPIPAEPMVNDARAAGEVWKRGEGRV